jgi:hypothetical protein
VHGVPGHPRQQLGPSAGGGGGGALAPPAWGSIWEHPRCRPQDLPGWEVKAGYIGAVRATIPLSAGSTDKADVELDELLVTGWSKGERSRPPLAPPGPPWAHGAQLAAQPGPCKRPGARRQPHAWPCDRLIRAACKACRSVTAACRGRLPACVVAGVHPV